MMSLDFFEQVILSNRVEDYLIALGILVLGFFIIKLIKSVILERLKRWSTKTTTVFDDRLIRIFEKSLIPIGYLGIFYIAISNLTLHPTLAQVINILTLILGTFLGIGLLIGLAEYLLRLYWITRQERQTVDVVVQALIPAIRTAIWAIGIIFLLDNLGFDISAVIAGLGVGGIAVALASQGVLQDLFSYFCILLDRPFELGDFIIVGDYLGTVQDIGIKTTRLTSLSGEQIIIANTDLTGSRIRNFKRMERRRIVFKIGVIYDTTKSQLEAIPKIIRQIIESLEMTTFDRSHFSDYGDFSLNFETVYYVLSSEYSIYMDIQQEINFRLKQEFEQLGIEFAYPTQVVYVAGTSSPESLIQATEAVGQS